jgi:hypothetical protein
MPIVKKTPSVALPDFERPFQEIDFRGYFPWTKKLSRSLGGHLYHACHEDELDIILDIGALTMRSTWQIELPKHGLCTLPGVWTGLNDFSDNFYGPCLLKFPISVLNGRQFMVFWRKGARDRFFFVQYESRIPTFTRDGNSWRWVRPEHYFAKIGDNIYRKSRAIYDIVLTAPLPLTEYEVESVRHPVCISQKCNRMSAEQSAEIVARFAEAQARKVIGESADIQALLNHFPCLIGKKVALQRPGDDE